jgi:hypothetical protein
LTEEKRPVAQTATHRNQTKSTPQRSLPRLLARFRSPHSIAWACTITAAGCVLLSLFLAGWLDEKQATVVGGIAAALWAVWKIHVDAAHRDHERRIEARRSVYLEIAKATSAPIGYLTNIANLAIPLGSSVEKLNEAFAIMNKTHVVADEETLNAALASNEAFTEALFRLVRQRVELEAIQSRRKNIFDQITAFAKHEQSLLDTLNTPLSDSDRKKLMEYLHDVRNKGAELAAEDANLNSQAAKLQTRLSLDASRASLDHGINAAKVNLLVRRELESPLSDKYVPAIQASCDRTHDKFKEFVEEIFNGSSQSKPLEPGSTGTDSKQT